MLFRSVSQSRYNQSKTEVKKPSNEQIITKPAEQSSTQASASAPKKLSYKEKRELELLPALIETLDAELSALQQQVNDPQFFRQSAESTQKTLNQLHETESKLAHAYERWEQLEALNQQ